MGEQPSHHGWCDGVSLGRTCRSRRPWWSDWGVEDEAVVDRRVEAVGLGFQGVSDGRPVGLGSVCTAFADYHRVEDVSQSGLKALSTRGAINGRVDADDKPPDGGPRTRSCRTSGGRRVVGWARIVRRREWCGWFGEERRRRRDWRSVSACQPSAFPWGLLSCSFHVPIAPQSRCPCSACTASTSAVWSRVAAVSSGLATYFAT